MALDGLGSAPRRGEGVGREEGRAGLAGRSRAGAGCRRAAPAGRRASAGTAACRSGSRGPPATSPGGIADRRRNSVMAGRAGAVLRLPAVRGLEHLLGQRLGHGRDGRPFRGPTLEPQSPLREGSPVVSGGRRGASVRAMTSIRLTILALAILAASAVAGIAAYSAGVVDPGFTYGFSHDDAGRQTLVVASVRPGGLAWHEGVEPGFIVLSLDVSVNGGGIDEQVYTPPGAVEAQQAAAASVAVPGLHGQAGRAAVAAPAGLPRVAGLRAQLGHRSPRAERAGALRGRPAVPGRPRLARLPQARPKAGPWRRGAAPRRRGLAAVPAARLPHADPDPRRADERARGRCRPRRRRGLRPAHRNAPGATPGDPGLDGPCLGRCRRRRGGGHPGHGARRRVDPALGPRLGGAPRAGARPRGAAPARRRPPDRLEPARDGAPRRRHRRSRDPARGRARPARAR